MNTDNCFEYSLAALATDRDAPLTFAWRTSQSEMAALELRPAHDWRYEDARNAVLTEAALAANHGRSISYSRRKAHYVGRQRYYGPSYAYRTVLAAVSDGVAAGLLKEQRAHPGSRDRQSCFRATSRLSRLLKTCPPQDQPAQEVIWLRDGKGRLIDYQDCPLTDRLRQEVETINRQLQSIVVAFSGPDVRSEGNWWVIGEAQYFSAPPRLRRVFNRLRSDYDRDGKRIKRTSAKSGKLVKTPVPKMVSDALDVLFPHDAVTLLVNSRGTSWTENGFRSSAFKFLRRLEAEGKVDPGLTIHGLRHTCGTLLRELGFDKDTIADMLGQQDAGMAEWYARDADLERKLNGVVKKIDRHLNRKSAR